METKICPVCGKKYSDYPAISRRDNKTKICPDCGLKEALNDWLKPREEAKNALEGKNYG